MKLKKLFAGLISLAAALLAVCAITVCAGAETSGDYEYSILDDGTVEITKYTGSSTDLEIPSTLAGKKVTSIANSTFHSCKNLKIVNIPATIRNINAGAFPANDVLVSINVDDNNEYYASLYGVLFNKNMTELICCPGEKEGEYTIPDTVKTIKSGAFGYCDKLVSITLPNGLTSIESSAFGCCYKLETINIPSGVKTIGDSAFYCCYRLKTVNLPNGLLSIEDSAFRESGITSITIPGSVTDIGLWAFLESDLESVIILNGVTNLGSQAFEDCKSLTTVSLPDSLTNINVGAFSGCSKLSSITIPKNVTSIGEYAFDGCSNLASINIPDSVASIGKYAFDGTLFISSQTSTVKYAGNWAVSCDYYATTATIKNGTVGIANYIFCWNLNLTSITIPDSVTFIGEEAFSCSNLEEVYYTGLKAQWDKIDIRPNNEDLLDATIHYGKHISADPVMENEVPATCVKDGSYDEVVYCSDCGEELSRTPVTVPATGKHTYVDKVVAPTYTAQGYTEHTCSVCGDSYKDTYTAKKTIPSVTGLSLKGRSGDALRIAWTKNTSADGYIIEMKSGNTWTRVGKITKNSTVEFKKSKLKAGTAYTFRVKAYKMSGKTALYSGYTTISARTNPSAVSGLKLKGRAADALRLTWTKNTSADGYIIEMKNGSKWERVAKITKNSTVEFRKDKLKAGTAYSFRVKAYKMSGKTALYSGYTTISARTNPSAVSGLKLKNANSSAVRLAWTKNTSADGYIIEMKSGNSWVRVGKVTKNSTVEFRKGSLKGKTSYTFRIKAYKMSGKTALYSGYTTVTVKTK